MSNPLFRYVDAKCLPTKADKRSGEHRYTDKAVAEMQRAIRDALRSDDPLPAEMQHDLAFAFEFLCEGVAADLLTPVKRPGGRESPIAKKTQEEAIRYLRWAEDGRIADPNPVATVALSFQVDKRTVRNWRSNWENRAAPPVLDELGAEQVIRIMKAAGSQYRRFISKRAKGPKHG
jgi:hypothetical protein